MKDTYQYIKNEYSNFEKLDNGYYTVTTVLPDDMPYINPHIDLYGTDYGLQGKWGLCDEKGKELIKPQYLFPLHKFHNIYMVSVGMKNEDGIITEMVSGLVNERNKEIVPIKYKYMTCLDNKGDYFKVWDSDLQKDGILDINNNIVVPFIYDYISEFLKYEQLVVKNNDLYGIYDFMQNKEIVAPKYKGNIEIVNRNLFLITDGNNRIVINEKEEILREEKLL